MKPLGPIVAAIAAAAFVAPLGAQPPQPRTRQVQLPPLPGFVPGHSQRLGDQQIVEFVPRGQTVQRYTKLVTLTSFRTRPGVTGDQLLRAFVQRYGAGCPRAQVRALDLGAGNRGARIDCPRHPKTGRPETNFVRVVPAYPATAIVSYMTTYLAMPSEAAFARDFLGRVAVR